MISVLHSHLISTDSVYPPILYLPISTACPTGPGMPPEFRLLPEHSGVLQPDMAAVEATQNSLQFLVAWS